MENKTVHNELKKVLWLEDQSDNFNAYQSALFRSRILLDTVTSVSEAEKKIKEEKESYGVFIFDIRVPAGDDPKWIEFEARKHKEKPFDDSYLGLEFMHSLFRSPLAKVNIDPFIRIDPKRVIAFSVVSTRTDEIHSLGIPEYQILYKASATPRDMLHIIQNILK